MKKTTLLLTLGLCFGISGLAQTKKQPNKRPRTATKQSAKPKQTRKAKPPTSSKAARKQSAKPKRSTVKRPQRPTVNRSTTKRQTPKQSTIKRSLTDSTLSRTRPSPNIGSSPTRNLDKSSTKFSAEVDSLLKATPLFKKLDTNRNGSISKRELQRLSNISKQLDISKDNKLSAIELLGEAARKQFWDDSTQSWTIGGAFETTPLKSSPATAQARQGKVNSISELNPFGVVGSESKKAGLLATQDDRSNRVANRDADEKVREVIVVADGESSIKGKANAAKLKAEVTSASLKPKTGLASNSGLSKVADGIYEGDGEWTHSLSQGALRLLDTDKDNHLSLTELKNTSALFNTLDVNKDNELSTVELLGQ